MRSAGAIPRFLIHPQNLERDMQMVEIGRVVCHGTDGARHVVVQRQKIIEHPTYGKAKGTIDFILTNGQHVNEMDDGRFQIVQTDEIVTPQGWKADA
jgi:hypothetical protein